LKWSQLHLEFWSGAAPLGVGGMPNTPWASERAGGWTPERIGCRAVGAILDTDHTELVQG
jgi:hypothetical protein